MLDGTGRLPEPLRTPNGDAATEAENLPAFLSGGEEEDAEIPDEAVAAE